jgi:transaldolase/glucose-6-phosphate isomerase
MIGWHCQVGVVGIEGGTFTVVSSVPVKSLPRGFDFASEWVSGAAMQRSMASKNKASVLTKEYEMSHSLPKEEPVFHENGLALFADPGGAAELGRHNTLSGYLKSFLGHLQPGDYVALLAYIERNDANIRALGAMRRRIRDETHAATCLGFGPRFQHSTGQAYKGGPNSGLFLQVTCDDPAEIDVPGHSYSFGVVKTAQARGDLKVLVERGRRALRVHLRDVDTGLAELGRAIDAAFL